MLSKVIRPSSIRYGLSEDIPICQACLKRPSPRIGLNKRRRVMQIPDLESLLQPLSLKALKIKISLNAIVKQSVTREILLLPFINSTSP